MKTEFGSLSATQKGEKSKVARMPLESRWWDFEAKRGRQYQGRQGIAREDEDRANREN
jgi:hypothetical protein